MANYISVDQFVKETNGKAYDIDHTAGTQCVDGIKVFNYKVYGKYDFNCGNGYAYGLWTNYGSNGVEKYFDKYTYKEAKKGDWIIWNWNSKPAPKSHVAMLYEKLGNKVKAYGQNQNGIKAFNFANVSTDGILGVLRPKIYVTEDFLPERGYFTKGDKGDKVKAIDEFFSNKVRGEFFGDYTVSVVKEFQRQHNLEQDGNIGKITLAEMIKEGFKE